jgi:sensor histidine kinase YesM
VSNQRNQKKDDTSGTGIGLSNLMMRYDILSGKKIQIQSTEAEFIVKLPLIKLAKKDIK